MRDELTIKITGEAGQGLQVISEAIGRLFQSAGYYVLIDFDFMSRIRGGNNFNRLRVSTKPVFAPRRLSDITVCLDKKSIALHLDSLTDKGVLVVDGQKYQLDDSHERYLDVPLHDMAQQTGGSELFVNAAACGLLAGMMHLEFDLVKTILANIFAGKGDDLIEKNIQTADQGFKWAKDNYKQDNFQLAPGKASGGLFLNGSEAIGLGALKAGIGFYCAYPMSPSTGVMTFLAGQMEKAGVVVEQAEDEIAAVNMALGAYFSGVRAMTGTSGGGLALMGEGVSLAGMTETPLVIMDAQRPAPATGFPTRTEQGDLNMVLHIGHGEFARVVLTPGNREEAFYLTQRAFNLAEKYQIPVFLLVDQYLVDSYGVMPEPDLQKEKAENYFITKKEKGDSAYQRYMLTDNGISPMARPGVLDDPLYADSDEHTQEGHITEDGEIRIKMIDKRLFKKMAGLEKEVVAPTVYQADTAELVLLGFGTTLGVMHEISEHYFDGKVGYVHLSQVWPFPGAAVEQELKKARKVLTIENNATGQLAGLLRQATGLAVAGSLLKYDGRPFNLDEVKEKIAKELEA